uniref:Ankyrin-3 n=1 Tax=Sipha flava TaxID=143950 RepID=A0A2S2PZN6_9HEMI
MHYYYRKRSSASAVDLRKAIERGNYAAVKRIITRNRYLTHCPTGRAADHPVHVAAQSGHQRIVGLLLHRGADPDARNANRKTPVHLSILHSRPLVVGLLMDNGADPTVVDGYDNTPLDLAALMNDKRCLDVLLNRDMPNSVLNRALFKAATQDNTILMNKLINRGANIEHVDEATGYTALLVAMKIKHLRASQFLLEKGADPYVQDQFGWTCLHFAVYYEYSYRTLLMVLHKYVASKRSVDSRTFNQETALHLAARRGNVVAAAALLQAGAHVDAVDRKNKTPLLAAVHRHKDAVAELLVRAGASVNRVAGSAGSPLHLAVARHHLPLVRLMLEHGSAVVDPRDGDDNMDWTVIHSVCESGELKTAIRTHASLYLCILGLGSDDIRSAQ